MKRPVAFKHLTIAPEKIAAVLLAVLLFVAVLLPITAQTASFEQADIGQAATAENSAGEAADFTAEDDPLSPPPAMGVDGPPPESAPVVVPDLIDGEEATPEVITEPEPEVPAATETEPEAEPEEVPDPEIEPEVEPEMIPEEQPVPREYLYEDTHILVQVQVGAGDLPEQAQLVVTPLTAEQHADEYSGLLEAINDQIVSSNQAINSVLLYDISFLVDGVEVEPQNPVKVTIRYKNGHAFSRDDIAQASELLLLHMVEQQQSITVEDVTDSIEAIEDLNNGISLLEFAAESFSTYGALLLDTVVSGNYYQQVEAIDSTEDCYLIVAANGTLAFTANQNLSPYASTLVSFRPVKGNPGYYTLGEGISVTNEMRFRFNKPIASADNTTVRSLSGSFLNLAFGSLLSPSASPVYLTFNPSAKVWQLKVSADSNTALYANSSGFKTSSVANLTTQAGRPNNALISFKHVNIYKEVSTSLTIPEDITVRAPTIMPYTDPATPPEYDPYLPTSEAKSGQYTAGESMVSYYSDAATSQIEAIFSGDPADDGKVWTDKSVVYGNDDYAAFPENSYQNGTFSVTLSALAQQSQSFRESATSIPMDVVFLLDVSGSMDMEENGVPRAQTMVTALNNTINHILQENENNRIGVACFSYAAHVDTLPLDRYYTAASEETMPDYRGTGYQYFQLTGNASDGYKVENCAGLRSASGDRTAMVSFHNPVVGATYTQHGLEKAYNLFRAQTDTSYTFDNGLSVPRTPLLILLSDGMPTYATPNYVAPSMGPHYGSGSGTNSSVSSSLIVYGGDGINAKGVMGYYTVLSATYFKNMIGNHYGAPAKVGTIGIGIQDYNASNPYYASTDGIGDYYLRAVLNPTAQNVNLSGTNPDASQNVYGKQFYQLITNTFSERSILVRNNSDLSATIENESPIGRTNMLMPVIPNPYSASEYSYADYSFIGTSYNSADLTEIFNQIVDTTAETVPEYAPVLEEGTILTFEDKIGTDMELKSNFVIRYNGTNYACTYLGISQKMRVYRILNKVEVKNSLNETVNLQELLIFVGKDEDNQQTIRWQIPSKFMPAYRKSESGNFYLETLPIRLCYQVGPTAELSSPGVYYTNAWQDGDSAFVTFTPNDENTYYKNAQHVGIGNSKAENTTQTAPTYITAERAGSYGIVMRLGNNGKLTVEETQQNIAVEKIWLDEAGIPESGADKPAVTVTLYRKLDQADAVAEIVPLDNNPCQLSSSNEWRQVWQDLDGKNADGVAYLYYVAETTISGYDTTYQVNSGGSTTTEHSADIHNGTVTIRNQRNPDYCDVTVSKLWQDLQGNPLQAGDIPEQIEVVLSCWEGFQPRGSEELFWLDSYPLETITLNAAAGWSHTWQNLPRTQVQPEYEGTFVYHYYIEEITVPSGFTVTYSDNNIPLMSTDKDPFQDGTITITNIQIAGPVFPETGGAGTAPFIVGGALLMAVSAGIYQTRKRINKQGGRT